MNPTLDALRERCGVHLGRGDGPESGPFVARIELGRMPDDLGVEVRYEAWSDAQGLQHRERTLVAPDAATGELSLWVLCGEIPGVVRLGERSPGVFESDDAFTALSARIVIGLDDGGLSYAWWWALPGAELVEQSRAEVRPA
ncbi:MAG: hypothetical protein S0880_18620 [Actinomycetota bacterium]|nr:hypothetical protein [Actinomycetota bacterium]